MLVHISFIFVSILTLGDSYQKAIMCLCARISAPTATKKRAGLITTARGANTIAHHYMPQSCSYGEYSLPSFQFLLAPLSYVPALSKICNDHLSISKDGG